MTPSERDTARAQQIVQEHMDEHTQMSPELRMRMRAAIQQALAEVRAENENTRSALLSLRNEVAGALALHISDCIGHTNAACLRGKVETADLALAQPAPERREEQG